ncbi:MAG: hypothetical protein GF401_01705 [Chitinivibrionales bacterium]|nr:hypothetical protein [Chitinivibrionales bacterium]
MVNRDAGNADASGDKVHPDLPGLQERLFYTLVDTGKPVVVVNLSGSAIALVSQQ